MSIQGSPAAKSDAGRHKMGSEPLTPRAHYDFDPVGRRLKLVGAGLLAYMTSDQLHPPMVDDESIWRDGRRWYEGAVQHVLRAARLCDLQPGQVVLDVGCGVGGPARLLVDCFDVDVLCTSISTSQLKTCERINATNPRWKEKIATKRHNCQEPFTEKGFDCAWSMNMLYHVEDKLRFLSNVHEALRGHGALLIDDWMLTPRATDQDKVDLAHHFVSPHFTKREEIFSLVNKAGFRIVEFLELGHVGRTHLANHFETQFRSHFRARIIEANPDYGRKMAQQFCDAVRYTIELYSAEKLTYCVLVARK